MAQIPSENLSFEQIQPILKTEYGLEGKLDKLASYSDENLRLTDSDGQVWVVKIAGPGVQVMELEMENEAMAHLSQQGLAVPLAQSNQQGKTLTVVNSANRDYYLRVLNYLPGDFYADSDGDQHGPSLWQSLGQFMANMVEGLASFKHQGAYRYLDWDLAQGFAVCQMKKSLLPEHERQQVEGFLNGYSRHVMPVLDQLPKGVIHNDGNDHNLLVDDVKQPSKIIGLIDFGDMVYSHQLNELAVTSAYALMGQNDQQRVLENLCLGYHRVHPLSELELDVLPYLIALRLCTTVCNSALAIQQQPNNEYLKVSIAPAWGVLAWLQETDFHSLRQVLGRVCGYEEAEGLSADAIMAIRQRHLGKTLSLSYQQPLKIVRGKGAYLYNEQGRAYLDMVNNVCHVGHCHPRVVAAGQRQMARLNTNTRYLHDNLVQYAQALVATMPQGLDVCMFVNSGSEANELAFRLAQCATGAKDLLVVEGAYHGNTSACINASPYKFDGPGGRGLRTIYIN